MSRRVTMQAPMRMMAELPSPKRKVEMTDLWRDEAASEAPREPVGEPAGHAYDAGPEVEFEPDAEVRMVAYVCGPERCRYSESLLDLAREVGAPLRVYDIDLVDPPSWLPGTPTVETASGDVYCGDAAFDYVARCGESRVRAVGAAPKPARGAVAAPPHHATYMRKVQPDIEPRTLDNVAGAAVPVAQMPGPAPTPGPAPGGFAAAPSAHAGGGALSSVFLESQRLGAMAEGQREQPLDAQKAFDEIMRARS